MAATVFPPVPLLEGADVRLRPLHARDADDLFALHADERVMRYWSFRAWTQRQQAVEHIARLARERLVLESYAWTATLADDDRLIGTCSLFGVHRDEARAVIGYALAPEWWHRGLATQMLRLALDHAFAALALERIEADIDVRNLASCRLAERLRFRRAGLFHQRGAGAGELDGTALYVLLRADHARV